MERGKRGKWNIRQPNYKNSNIGNGENISEQGKIWGNQTRSSIKTGECKKLWGKKGLQVFIWKK